MRCDKIQVGHGIAILSHVHFEFAPELLDIKKHNAKVIQTLQLHDKDRVKLACYILQKLIAHNQQ